MVAGVLASLSLSLPYNSTISPARSLPRSRHSGNAHPCYAIRVSRVPPCTLGGAACGRYTRIKSIVDASSWSLHWISIGLAEFSRPFLFAKETWCSNADCKLYRARGERTFRRRWQSDKNLYLDTHVPLISIRLDRNTLEEPRSMFRNGVFSRCSLAFRSVRTARWCTASIRIRGLFISRLDALCRIEDD